MIFYASTFPSCRHNFLVLKLEDWNLPILISFDSFFLEREICIFEAECHRDGEKERERWERRREGGEGEGGRRKVI